MEPCSLPVEQMTGGASCGISIRTCSCLWVLQLYGPLYCPKGLKFGGFRPPSRRCRSSTDRVLTNVHHRVSAQNPPVAGTGEEQPPPTGVPAEKKRSRSTWRQFNVGSSPSEDILPTVVRTRAEILEKDWLKWVADRKPLGLLLRENSFCDDEQSLLT